MHIISILARRATLVLSCALSIGIVGLPNVGKSTLFNALTKKSVLVANYPFATIDPSVGVVAVPDERLAKLSTFSKSAKTVPAAIEFTDIAGLVKGASEGQGLGNQFLSNIRETDAIAEVVRIFRGRRYHPCGQQDRSVEGHRSHQSRAHPRRPIARDEALAEFRQRSQSRQERRGHRAKVLERVKAALEPGKLASTVSADEFEAPFLKQIHLLTSKPFMYVLNKKSGGKNLDEADKRKTRLDGSINGRNCSLSQIIRLKMGHRRRRHRAGTEGFGRQGQTRDCAKASAAKDDGINNLIKSGYELLDLMTYFTTGEDETRAWTIKRVGLRP